MEYKFKSIFDREREYTIDTEEPLNLYNTFALSIKKIDKNDKSFGYDNIDCVLKYSKRGTLDGKTIDLDSTNFDGYSMLLERYKKKSCLSMGEAIELVSEKSTNEYENTTLDIAQTELKLAFEEYVRESGIMDALFKCFLNGVSYGKRKR